MKKKIVVIEDNDDVRENIGEILELSGYDVATAPNGIEGVKAVQLETPDLVICDIMMPELDGYGVLHILQKDSDTAGIPFIFLTAKSERSDFRKGMNLGADDYITKPFEEVQLLEAVEIRLNKKASDTRPAGRTNHGNAADLLSAAMKGFTEDAERRAYPRKAPVFLQGAYPRYLFKVKSGSVKISTWTEFGKELILGLYTRGEYLGWEGVLTDAPYRSLSSALEDSELELIPKEKVSECLQSNPALYEALVYNLLEGRRLLHERLLFTAYESVRKRMAYILRLLYEKHQGEPIQLLREDIAAVAGISKETAIRVLSSFKEEGLITIDHNAISINSVDDLDHIMG